MSNSSHPLPTKRIIYLVVAALIFIAIIAAVWWLRRGPDPNALVPLEPAQGVYFGATLNWDADSLDTFAQRTGYTPAVAVRFFDFPFTDDELVKLEEFVSQVVAARAIALISLEPIDGLDAVTPEVAADLATRIAAYEDAGAPIMLRFGHEMNGGWYVWSQQPTAYRAAYRRVAEAIRAQSPNTALLWAPNYGGGYPYVIGDYAAQPGTDAYDELDTNHDGVLTMADDMYAPYYPGDDVVDWVGLSLYHWGNEYPWGENEVPEAEKFVNQVRGEYNGLNGDERAVLDFYDEYVERRGKPLAVPETAAFYSPTAGGASALLIKQSWWRQVWGEETLTALPRLKLVGWFDVRKPEKEVNDVMVDWSATLDPATLDALRDDLTRDQLIFAPVEPAR